MRFNQQAISRTQKRLKLRDDLEVLITALPIGHEKKLNAIFPMPIPPSITINRVGGKSEEKLNFNDPKYRADVEAYEMARTAFTVHLVLSQDPGISFDHQPATKDGLIALFHEMTESGLTEGELGRILKEVVNISGLSQDDIDKAKENF